MMSFMPTLLLVCLLALDGCDTNKLLPQESGQYEGRSRRQDLSCSICERPPDTVWRKALPILPELGPSFQKVKQFFQNIFGTDINTIEDVQSAINQNLADIQAETVKMADKLSTALNVIDTCEPLDNLFLGLNIHFNQFLMGLSTDWAQLVTDVDPELRYAALAAAMAKDIPTVFILIRDVVFSSMNVLLHYDCPQLGPLISDFLNPYGDVAAAVTEILSSPGSTSTDLVKRMFYSLLSEGNGGALDIWHIFSRLFAGALKGLHSGIDISEMTGGFCQSQPEDENFKLAIQNIVCGIVNELGRERLPKQYDYCYS